MLCNELGIERDTAERRARKLNLDLDNLFLRDACSLMMSSKEEALTRKAESEANLNELTLAERKGILRNWEDINEEWMNRFLPLKKEIFQLAQKSGIEKEMRKVFARWLETKPKDKK
jgi:hypothetical protein